jgi:signal transduction histidine kinase
MKKQLRVLMVEDIEEDARLVLRELSRAGFEPQHTRVASRVELLRALGSEWDVVLCDYSMPGFSGMEALALVRESVEDLPFIIVSGTVGETRAVEIMRAGAHDYVFKNNLQRLGVVIERELREAERRREHRGLQEQLLLAERMASIGMVAAGVVHEINNPLTALLGSAELALQALRSKNAAGVGPEHSTAQSELDRVLEAAERLSRIVADVKLFSHAGTDPIDAVDVHAALSSSVRLALHEAAGRCQILTDYGQTPPVNLSASRLGQVFLNLLLNAAQAIAPGNASENHIHISTHTDAEGWAVVEISDTGSGIAPALQKTLFEPFITTKAVGAGTGLGLFITQRIVKEAGGRLEFVSELGHGTRFRVCLPACPERRADPSAGTPPVHRRLPRPPHESRSPYQSWSLYHSCSA